VPCASKVCCEKDLPAEKTEAQKQKTKHFIKGLIKSQFTYSCSEEFALTFIAEGAKRTNCDLVTCDERRP
jgi:hypothetical protein